MANIIQKIFLSKFECSLIDAINKSDVKMTHNDDVQHMFSTTSYSINNNKMNIMAVHQWHHAQGDNYTLNITSDSESPRTPNRYLADDIVAHKFVRKIFMRMQRKYAKQK